MIYEFKNGFKVDFTQIYHETAISSKDLIENKKVIAGAAEKMNDIRKSGLLPGHTSKDGALERVLFPTLVRPDARRMERLIRMAEMGKEKYDTAVSFGIGGSYLGNQVLFDLFCGPHWNQKNKKDRKGCPRLYFSGNNLDPESTTDLITELLRQKKGYQAQKQSYRALLIVISKSGQTVDTMVPFFVVREALDNAGIEYDVWAVTSPDQGKEATLLGNLANQENWPRFEVPDGVGGRFSVFSEVGLVTAALTGVDIEEFIAGALEMEESSQSLSWEENPALLNGALKWLSATRYDKWVEIFMPYGASLKSTAEWYVQLAAESLGKRNKISGEKIEYGRTPVVAVGTTDMHAQTQAHQDGRRDKIIQFIGVKEWRQDAKVPVLSEKLAAFSHWSGLHLGDALEAARKANEKALANDDRWSSTLFLPTINPYHVGSLLYFLMLSVVYEGLMAEVDPFDQPGVEAYKKIMDGFLKELNSRSN